MRGGGVAFMLQLFAHGPRPLCGRLGVRLRLLEVMLGPRSRAGAGTALRRRRQLHARPPCLRQADSDGLLRRPRAVLAFADVLDLFMYEFASLRRRRLTLALVLSCSSDRLL